MRFPTSPTPLGALLVAGALAGAPHSAVAQSLRGSPASVDRMYDQARSERLPFHETGRAVRTAARGGALVRLASSRNVTLRNVSFPYVTSATRTFVERLGARYRRTCGRPLVVTSATRPATRQPANSVAQSVHPTGMAIDLRKPSGRCLRWLRTTLLSLEEAGVVEATEEFRPPHFHVAVYPTSYARYAAARDATVPERRQAPAAVATAEAAAGDVYRVRPGDTLWDIARKRDVTVEQLRAANGLARSAIRPGQRLVIPTQSGTAASAVDDGGQ